MNPKTRQMTKRYQFLALALLAGAAWAVFAATPAAAMQKMAEAEMDEIVAGSFSEFTLEDSTASIRLNINAEAFAEIDEFRAGYFDDGTGEGWDQHWLDVMMGTGTETEELFRLSGFMFEARFDDLESENRQLVSMKMGFESVSGDISADFQSLTREGYSRRQQRGEETYRFDDDRFIMEFYGGDEKHPGVYMDFGDAQPVND